MPRWMTDEIDVACESWAYQWVEHFGRNPLTAARYIGPLRCTLGRVRELHDGASSVTDRANQHWPEVFVGTALAVSQAFQCMSLAGRSVLFAHYVLRRHDPQTWARRSRPVKQSIVAADLGISLSEYHHRRDTAKACVSVALGVSRAPEYQHLESAPSRHKCTTTTIVV